MTINSTGGYLWQRISLSLANYSVLGKKCPEMLISGHFFLYLFKQILVWAQG